LRPRFFTEINDHLYEHNGKKYLLLSTLIGRLPIFKKHGTKTDKLALFLRQHDIEIETLVVNRKQKRQIFAIPISELPVVEEVYNELKENENHPIKLDCNIDQLESPEREIVFLSLTGTSVIDISRILSIDFPTVASTVDKYATFIQQQYLPHIRTIMSEVKRGVI
jgi:hypothetical protein